MPNGYHGKSNTLSFAGLCCITFFLVIVRGLDGYCAETVNAKAIAFVESSFNSKAIGDGGKALGLHQLHAEAIKDVNRFKKRSYKHKDALDPQKSFVIADAYLNEVIPFYFKKLKIKDTLDNRLTAYNMGIGAVKRGKKSFKYIKKYNRALKSGRGIPAGGVAPHASKMPALSNYGGFPGLRPGLKAQIQSQRPSF